MPKTQMDYSKCCIYKIEHINDETLLYVGHTTSFDKRKTAHKSNCYNEKNTKYNLKLYQMIRNNGGWEMFKMIEVEKYPCNDRREAERRENEVMKELKSNMNTYRSYITEREKKDRDKRNVQEYQEENKTKIKEYKKDYYEENKTKIKEYKKDYYEDNKEKVKEKVKVYYDKNKVKINEKMNQYYDKNKVKINEKIKCDCGCEVGKQFINRHQATKKHISLMNKI